MSAKDRYEENITELNATKFSTLVITQMSYDLEASLIHLDNEVNSRLYE